MAAKTKFVNNLIESNIKYYNMIVNHDNY